MDWIELLHQVEEAEAIRDLVANSRADLLGMISALALTWFAHRWVTFRSGRRHHFSIGTRVMGGLLQLLISLVLLVLGLVFAVARTAGRSTFYAGGRF